MKKGSGVEDISLDDKKKVDAKDSKKSLTDPLRWFSVIPPTSLKQSQVRNLSIYLSNYMYFIYQSIHPSNYMYSICIVYVYLSF